MGSSQSLEEKTKNGGDWKGKIFFDSGINKLSEDSYTITESELKLQFCELRSTREAIRNVRIYKSKLTSVQLTMAILYHAYVVFETDQWWWSIEQNTEGITVQRAKNLEAVRDKYRKGDRKWVAIKWSSLIIEDLGTGTMADVADFLYTKNFLNKPYGWTGNNCKHFAKAFFDEVTFKFP